MGSIKLRNNERINSKGKLIKAQVKRDLSQKAVRPPRYALSHRSRGLKNWLRHLLSVPISIHDQ
jgi:hypothetical protein